MCCDPCFPQWPPLDDLRHRSFSGTNHTSWPAGNGQSLQTLSGSQARDYCWNHTQSRCREPAHIQYFIISLIIFTSLKGTVHSKRWELCALQKVHNEVLMCIVNVRGLNMWKHEWDWDNKSAEGNIFGNKLLYSVPHKSYHTVW